MLWQIIREKEFDKKVKKIAKNFSRMNELDMAIDYALSHQPLRFYNLKDNHYLWVAESLTKDTPTLLIYYTADKKTVNLLDVKIAKEQ